MAGEGGRRARNRIEGFVRIVSDNFHRGDLRFICTYRGGISAVEANREMRRFIRGIRETLDMEGLDPDAMRWMYITKCLSARDDREMTGRYVHHLLVSGAPMTLRDDIAALWSCGECQADAIRDSPESLARYMAESLNGQTGVCSYSMSRSIKREKRGYAYRDTKKEAEDMENRGCTIGTFGATLPSAAEVADYKRRKANAEKIERGLMMAVDRINAMLELRGNADLNGEPVNYMRGMTRREVIDAARTLSDAAEALNHLAAYACRPWNYTEDDAENGYE